MITLEICIDTPEGLAATIDGGADRVELCSALGLGGLTPSPGLIAAATRVSIPAHAMIRPIAGGFDMSEAVLTAACDDIRAIRDAGLAGIVIGATVGTALHVSHLAHMIALAGGMEVTLHRAIDLCADPLTAIDQAVDLGITRILTSGRARTAHDGTEMIAKMQRYAAGRITIMAGSGVTPENAPALVVQTGINAVHASCATAIPERPDVAGFGFGPSHIKRTDAHKIKELRRALNSL